MDTPDLLMSSQQQAAGAEQRPTRDLGCPDGISFLLRHWEKRILLLCTEKVMVHPSAQMWLKLNMLQPWRRKKTKINVKFKSKTLKFFSPSTFMNCGGIHIFQDWLIRNNTLYNCYNNWNKGKDRKENGRKQRKSGRRTDPFPSSLSVY